MHFFLAETITTITSGDFLKNLFAGALAGMIGQCARVAVGMKKTTDEARAANTSFKQQFDGGQLLVSLVLGAAAGAVAMFTAVKNITDMGQAFTTLFAAGYAGADFIEGFI